MKSPFILIECGIPRIADTLPEIRPNRLAVIGRFWEEMIAFDPESEFHVAPINIPTYSWFSKFLAYSFYNPIEPIVSKWVVSGKYDPQSVISLVQAGLEDDDDIIQQWFDADQVLELLNAADSYASMVLVLAVRCICGEHEISEEARRFVTRVLGKDW
jgi:hypothetical protein